jgi:hypothetical protein
VEELLPSQGTPKPSSKTPPLHRSSDGAEPTDPLTAIQWDLLASSKRLAQGKINAETLQLQKEILVRMNELIDAMMQSTMEPSAETKEKSATTEPSPSAPSRADSRSPINQPGTSRTQEDLMREQSDISNASLTDGQSDSNAAKLRASKDPSAQDGFSSDLLKSGAWGNLPERIRREMQAAPSQKFLPAYQKRIEDYYRRLAEEKSKP